MVPSHTGSASPGVPRRRRRRRPRMLVTSGRLHHVSSTARSATTVISWQTTEGWVRLQKVSASTSRVVSQARNRSWLSSSPVAKS